jgi:hypothetical protein
VSRTHSSIVKETSTQVPEVVVIGAGSAGLSIASALQRKGIRYIALESGNNVATSWRTRHEELTLNTVRQLSLLRGASMPRRLGRWVSRDDFVRYLEDYAADRELTIWHGESAVSVSNVDGLWQVVTDRDRLLVARHVVIATGHEREPWTPAWPGAETFTKPLLHVSQVGSAARFAGQRVLLVGAGNSGVEIAGHLVRSGVAELAVSVRSGPTILPRDVGRLPSQAIAVLMRRFPERLRDRVAMLTARLQFGDLSRHGLPTPAVGPYRRLRTTGVTVAIDQGFVQLPVSVICELLGVPEVDRKRFRSLAADLTVALELATEVSALEPADAAALELASYFRELVVRSRANPRDDLITAMVAARDAHDGRLSDVELVANLVVLLVAGFETTTNLLGNGLAILFDRPELAASLRAGAMPTAGFIEEVLRYDSPVQATSRVARVDDLTVEDVPIPKDGQLILLIGSANRDPARYPDPDRFDPARTGSGPLSFGAGAHICLGNSLARLEANTAFPRLLARFPDLALAGVPIRRDRLVLRGYESLPITIAAPR